MHGPGMDTPPSPSLTLVTPTVGRDAPCGQPTDRPADGPAFPAHLFILPPQPGRLQVCCSAAPPRQKAGDCLPWLLCPACCRGRGGGSHIRAAVHARCKVPCSTVSPTDGKKKTGLHNANPPPFLPFPSAEYDGRVVQFCRGRPKTGRLQVHTRGRRRDTQTHRAPTARGTGCAV